MTLRIIHATKRSDVKLQPGAQLVIWNIGFFYGVADRLAVLAACGDPTPDPTPMLSRYTKISTRRFLARPASVPLFATGELSPMEITLRLAASIFLSVVR